MLASPQQLSFVEKLQTLKMGKFGSAKIIALGFCSACSAMMYEGTKRTTLEVLAGGRFGNTGDGLLGQMWSGFSAL